VKNAQGFRNAIVELCCGNPFERIVVFSGKWHSVINRRERSDAFIERASRAKNGYVTVNAAVCGSPLNNINAEALHTSGPQLSRSARRLEVFGALLMRSLIGCSVSVAGEAPRR
jgi:hypothetical protein